jgi:hypothetical protein
MSTICTTYSRASRQRHCYFAFPIIFPRQDVHTHSCYMAQCGTKYFVVETPPEHTPGNGTRPKVLLSPEAKESGEVQPYEAQDQPAKD